ncbi:MAG: hypothetical protein GX443_08460 [Deltaproteobacteria bacterium]|nr:hypothetical protein [Deltaproteobacteria bacterium]
MSDLMLDQSVGKKAPASVDVGAFAEYIQEQANCMDRYGWCNGAGHLRKWASELRSRHAEEHNQLGDHGRIF